METYQVLTQLIEEQTEKVEDLTAAAREALKKHYVLLGAARQAEDHLEALKLKRDTACPVTENKPTFSTAYAEVVRQKAQEQMDAAAAAAAMRMKQEVSGQDVSAGDVTIKSEVRPVEDVRLGIEACETASTSK